MSHCVATCVADAKGHFLGYSHALVRLIAAALANGRDERYALCERKARPMLTVRAKYDPSRDRVALMQHTRATTKHGTHSHEPARAHTHTAYPCAARDLASGARTLPPTV